jgi:hypothetical protein
MKRLIIIICLSALHAATNAQEARQLVIVDSATRHSIDYVSVQSIDRRLALLTDPQGRIFIQSDRTVKAFVFYKLGYRRKVIPAEVLLASDTVRLSRRSYELAEVSISSDRLQTVLKDGRFFIDDYLVLDNSNFLVLTSRINQPWLDLACYMDGKRLAAPVRIREKDAFLFVDCLSNIHLVTPTLSRQLFFTSDSSFAFLPPYPRHKFDSTLALCALKLDSAVVLINRLPTVKLRNYFFNVYVPAPWLQYVKVSNKRTQLLYTAKFSKENQEMVDNEFRDTRMFGSKKSPAAIASELNLFFRTVGNSPYAPIFRLSDTIVIFDTQQKAVVSLTPSGDEIRTVKLDEKAFTTLHAFEILCDAQRNRFYYLTRDGEQRVLKEVNIHTGKLSESTRLLKTFAKKVMINDGRMFYLVKERNWDESCSLYRQDL